MRSDAAPAKAGKVALSLELLEEAARRLTRLAAVIAVGAPTLYAFHRLMQPQAAPLFDDPITRLVALMAILIAAGLVALRQYNVVTARTLLRLGMVFEIAVALAIAMVETSRPFDPSVAVLGVSAIGLWIVLAAAVIPTTPNVRLTLALAAATAWPVAYGINAARFGFVTESWRHASIWPAMNYLLAIFAYVVARMTYGTAPEAQSAPNLGSYKLISQIGEGGMGEVWRASHNLLARPAAIKLVKLDESRQELLAQRFHREANAIAALKSPHTVYLYDFGTTQDGRLYYVMELLDGISLQTLINGFGPQPASRVVAILKQMCRSLEEAHQAQIVHRDLKPSNVMICQVAEARDFVKVLDFGLAKPFGAGAASNLTVEGVTLGTPEYMAPEVGRGSRTVDARADLYALGCIAYFLLTGELVFTDSSPVGVALKHMRSAPVPPSKRTDRFIPPDLERVILACLEKDPANRPRSARGVERLLAACNVPTWREEDADAWWQQHLPPTSPLRSFAHAPPHMSSLVQKA
jgi:tRNA A-37 threonylcarbamoyl transferase component Bud32